MANELVTLNDMDRMAQAIASSGLFGMKRKEEALALMIVAQAENRHPGSVAAEYHIIQGRPALRADAMLARFQQAGGSVEWGTYTDAEVSAIFTHAQGGSVKIEWTMERAKKAGLTGKDNWNKYPRQMLRARVISEGVRTCYPAVCVGVYTPEEVQDFEPAHAPRRGRPPKDMGPAHIVDEDDEALKAIEQNAAPQAPATSPAATAEPPAAEPAGAAPDRISVDQQTMLADMLREAGIKSADAYAAWRITKISELPAAWYKRAVSWISEQKEAV